MKPFWAHSFWQISTVFLGKSSADIWKARSLTLFVLSTKQPIAYWFLLAATLVFASRSVKRYKQINKKIVYFCGGWKISFFYYWLSCRQNLRLVHRSFHSHCPHKACYSWLNRPVSRTCCRSNIRFFKNISVLV